MNNNYYIYPIKESGGYYSSIQKMYTPCKLPIFPEKFMNVFYPKDKPYSGFVDIKIDKGVVTECKWNNVAYSAYVKNNPVPANWNVVYNNAL